MTMPSIQMPAELPNFKASAHDITPDDMYAPVKRQTGGSRRRKLFTLVPRTVETELEVTQAQLQIYYAWHETVLLAGSIPFAAKIAKIGFGFEYWRAFIKTWSVQHNEGSTHNIKVTLRLTETPLDSVPDLSLSVEFLSPVEVRFDGGYGGSLATELFAPVEMLVDTGASLAVELIAALFNEFSGPRANPSMSLEIFVPADLFVVVEASSLFESEFSAGLVFELIDNDPLATEISVPLTFSVAITGASYNPTPTDVSLSVTTTVKPAVARFGASTDGTYYTRENTDGLIIVDNYYDPTTPNIAITDGLWIRMAGTDTGLSSNPGLNVFLMLNVERNWAITGGFGLGVQEFTGTVTIAKDPDGLIPVSVFNVDIQAEFS